ncbi:DUF808 domain-containing protein [Flaviflexus sp.]|uniref:DUF808 domain-containing protein n=1 Tax=Flaviflexus sp. TaxID=1969482 RepID=UPI00352E96E9
MAGGLVALLDDVAALARMAAASLDDVAAGAMKAGAKAAGVVIDDTAVTPQYLDGVKPNRELPIVKKIAIGSIRNKLIFILPVILLLSEFLPWILTPILMLGGTYLCYEGAEKVWEKFRGKHAEKEAPAAAQGPEAEDSIVKSATTTDFVLSAEIMVISLDQVVDESFWVRTLILVLVAIAITALVYGVVALLVKMDDIGLAMTKKDSPKSKKIGSGLVKAMPVVMDVISIVGTFAMLWVGGHIVLNGVYEFGFTPIHDFIHTLAGNVENIAVVGGLLAWLIDTAISLVIGLIWGLIVLAIVHPLLAKFGKGHGDHTNDHATADNRAKADDHAKAEEAPSVTGSTTFSPVTDPAAADPAAWEPSTTAPADSTASSEPDVDRSVPGDEDVK